MREIQPYPWCPTLLLVFIAVLCAACTPTHWRARFSAPDELWEEDLKEPFAKCHLRDGELVVLRDWKVDWERRKVIGSGAHFDAYRQVQQTGKLQVAMDSIALVETNAPRRIGWGTVPVLGVMTTVSLAATIYCAANPKACFGSCPTFYDPTAEEERLMAEGFSASVAAVLETADRDALVEMTATGGPVQLEMRNEALETHMVRGVRLLALPRPADGRVVATGDEYREAFGFGEPDRCTSMRGDCLPMVHAADGEEYRSTTDESELVRWEAMELAFDATEPGPHGLAIRARNSLLGTYLTYQIYAQLGHEAGAFWAKLDGGWPAARSRMEELTELLSTIHVDLLDEEGEWRTIGTYRELGPIARETQVVRLPDDAAAGPIHVRLRMLQGNWKLDAVQLVRLGAPVEPLESQLTAVEGPGNEGSDALNLLQDPERHLRTLPGDRHLLTFAELPERTEGYELFLEAKGYYLEWMRAQWLAEQDLASIAWFAVAPEAYLDSLAADYKRVEAEMEDLFWASRVRR